MSTKITTTESPAHITSAIADSSREPFVLWNHVQKALGELVFYRGWLRHHSAAEGGNGDWTHEDWRAYSVAALHELANQVESGGLEPPASKEVEHLMSRIDSLRKEAHQIQLAEQNRAAHRAYGVN